MAKDQLNSAINLFLDHKSYPSSITLAGAAEEIMGRAVTMAGKVSALEVSCKVFADFESTISDNAFNKKQFIDKQNWARNALKHLQEKDGPTITIDLEEAACWMLVRAIGNATELNLEIARYRDFENWFYENIVGM